MAVIKSGATTDNWTIDPTSKAGRVSLYDTAGNPIESKLDTAGDYHLGVSVLQSVYISSLNSNLSASILASTYWEGGSESTLGVASVQVNVFLSQSFTLTFYQSMNGTDWDITDSHDMPANYGESRTYQATASYYKIRVTNKSGASTATGRIQTALCPIVEVVPRALTKGGNLKVSVAAEWQSNTRTTGLYAFCTPRTIGSGSAPQNLMVLQNPSSTYWVAVRSLNVVSDCTTVLLTISPIIRVSRATAVSGGTSWTANIGKYQTQYPLPQATCLVATTADDAALTTITATAGTPLWQQTVDRQATSVGIITHANYNLMPDTGSDLRQIILAPGENLLVQIATTSAAATFTFLINCSFSEMLAL